MVAKSPPAVNLPSSANLVLVVGVKEQAHASAVRGRLGRMQSPTSIRRLAWILLLSAFRLMH